MTKVIHGDLNLPDTESGAHLRIRKSIGGKNKSQYKGVTWKATQRKWHASFYYTDKHGNGHKKHLGSFDDEREAAKAYDRMAIVFGLPTNLLKKVGTNVDNDKQ